MKYYYALIQFIKHDIWLKDNDNVRGPYLWLINALKALILSVRFCVNDRMMEKASALTYYTLLALVPFLALVLGLARGFGLQEHIVESLYNIFPGQHTILEWCFNFADRYLMHSEKGIIMGAGAALLFWVTVNLISNIESVFNEIWHIKKGRQWNNKIVNYLAFIILVPIIIAITSGSQIFLQTVVKSGNFDPTSSRMMLGFIRWLPYFLSPLIFTCAYKFIPNTNVEFTKAFFAGLIAGLGFFGFQQLYINGQIWVSKYDAIYGSFAALPLLLLFVQMSWTICLYGAELAFASQSVRNFDYEGDIKNISPAYWKFICIVVASLIYVRDRKNKDIHNPETFEKYPNLETSQIGQLLHMPVKLLSDVISTLEDLKVIVAYPDSDREDHFVWAPNQSVEQFSISDLIRRIEEKGTNQVKYNYKELFHVEWQTLEEMKEVAYEAGSKTLLSYAAIEETALRNLE